MIITGGKPVRVAMVVGKMRAGGVEAFLMNYYRHIDRDRVQFDFIIDEDSPNHELVPEIEGLGGRIFEVPRYQDLSHYIPTLEELFRRESWRIVHSQINALSVFPLMAAKRAGVPIRIAHSHTGPGSGEPMRNAAKNILRTVSNVYPTHRCACSDVAGRWLFGENAKFTVIPDAIELDKFAFCPVARNEVRLELNIEPDALVIGVVGRFMPPKNQVFLLDVFDLLSKYDDKAVLVFVGDGPQRVDVEKRFASLGLSERVRFVGQRVDVERMYQAFDVFILPSLYEGLGMVAIEAQVSNLPCLLSDRIPREVQIADDVRFLPLESTPMEWACEIEDSAWRTKRVPGIVQDEFASYEICDAAKRLTDFYYAIASNCEGILA